MSTYCLEIRSTANWQDVRYREYTTSKRKADAFKAVPKIAFTDSRHHLIPVVSESRGRREPTNFVLRDHVRDHLKVALKAPRPAPKAQIARMTAVIRGLVTQFDHQGCTCTFPDDECCPYAQAKALLSCTGESSVPADWMRGRS